MSMLEHGAQGKQKQFSEDSWEDFDFVKPIKEEMMTQKY